MREPGPTADGCNGTEGAEGKMRGRSIIESWGRVRVGEHSQGAGRDGPAPQSAGQQHATPGALGLGLRARMRGHVLCFAWGGRQPLGTWCTAASLAWQPPLLTTLGAARRPAAQASVSVALEGAAPGATAPARSSAQSARKMEPSTPTGEGSLLNSAVRGSRHSGDSCREVGRQAGGSSRQACEDLRGPEQACGALRTGWPPGSGRCMW